MSFLSRGFLGLVLWLILGFAFTEATVIGLNAWMMRSTQRTAVPAVAASQADSRN
jgi:hypothetical protein